MAGVRLDRLSVTLDRQAILHDITVEIPDGAFAAVVGPSGSGKSTLLRTIAGLSPGSSGRVWFDNVDVTGTKPADRDIGMVFQSPALLPRRNVRGNVRFPLELRRESAGEIHDRVTAEVRALGIEHLMSRRPDDLSRGEQQLVQIARTMVRMPRVLLLDEPFAPLDEHLRTRMRDEIRVLQEGYGVTTVMATNDPVDAMSLASLVIVLGDSPATAVQVGQPARVHLDPVSLDAAMATGTVWTVPARLEADASAFWAVTSDAFRLRLWSPALRPYVGRAVVLGLRTESVRRDPRGAVTVRLERIVPGSPPLLVCSLGGRRLTVRGAAEAGEVGTMIRVDIGAAFVFDAETSARLS